MKRLLKNKNWEINKDYNTDKILYLLIDRPDYIHRLNEFIWKNKKGNLHRKYDLPAYVGNNGSLEWCKYNVLHRKNNKPAKIWWDGVKEYFVNGKFPQ